MFGDATGVTEFLSTPRPVRVWYNAELSGADGGGSHTDLTFLNTPFAAIPSFYVRPVSPAD